MTGLPDQTDTLTVSADSVQDINFEIHLLSLNAAIKSAHIGSEGRALEVLAHAVKGLSDQSNGFVARINGLVEKIIAASRIGTDSKSETEEYNACRRQVAFDSDGGIMEHYQDPECGFYGCREPGGIHHRRHYNCPEEAEFFIRH